MGKEELMGLRLTTHFNGREVTVITTMATGRLSTECADYHKLWQEPGRVMEMM